MNKGRLGCLNETMYTVILEELIGKGEGHVHVFGFVIKHILVFSLPFLRLLKNGKSPCSGQMKMISLRKKRSQLSALDTLYQITYTRNQQ